MKRLFAVLVTTGLLTGCSDDAAKNEMKEILECSMASKLVGKTEMVDVITKHANWVAAKSGYQPGNDEFQQMHDEIKAKWNLRSLSRHDQDQLLVNVYNSTKCRSLHQGDPLSVDDVPPDA